MTGRIARTPHVAPLSGSSSPTLSVVTADIAAYPPSAERSAARGRSLTGLMNREVLRFGAVGVVNTGLDLGVYLILQLSGVPVVLANLLSTSVGLSFSFVANRRFTFSSRSTGRPWSQVALFIGCTGVGLWVVQPIVIFALERLLVAADGLGDWRVLLAKCGAIAVGMAWNWTLYNRVVFRRGAGPESTRGGDTVA